MSVELVSILIAREQSNKINVVHAKRCQVHKKGVFLQAFQFTVCSVIC